MSHIDNETRETRRAAVARLTRTGSTARQIAEQIGCSRRQVYRDRRSLGIALDTSPPLTEQQIERARHLLDDGASRAEVARTLGCDEATIRRRFPSRGWTPQQSAEYAATIRQGLKCRR